VRGAEHAIVDCGNRALLRCQDPETRATLARHTSTAATRLLIPQQSNGWFGNPADCACGPGRKCLSIEARQFSRDRTRNQLVFVIPWKFACCAKFSKRQAVWHAVSYSAFRSGKFNSQRLIARRLGERRSHHEERHHEEN